MIMLIPGWISRYTEKTGTMNTRFTLPPRRTLIAVLLCTGFGHAQAQTVDTSAEMATTLSTVVVTAAGFEQSVQDAPASITVVPHEELAKRAYPDVTEALKDIPGVVITGGGSGSDISIRGMASGYTMILVDGVRQNTRETRPNSDNAGIEQGWLPPLEAIERIEVIRGPMSSLYGSDAMGGVINIITRKVASEWRGSLRTEGTQQQHSHSGNIYAGNFHIAGPLKENLLGLQVTGNWSRRVEDRFVGGFNKQQTRFGAVKLSLTPNVDHDLTLEVGRTLQDRVATPGRSTEKGAFKKEKLDKNCSNKCATKDVWVPNTVSEANYAHNRYALSHNGRYGQVSSASHISREETDNPGRDMRLKNTEASTQWTLPVASHVVTAGASFLNEALADKGNELPSAVNKLERYQWALYAEDEWSLADSFALTGGVRMTRDENYGTHWTPRLYGVWHATDNFTLKGGVSTGFKAPGLRSAVADWGQVTGGRGDPAVIVGNPDLKPEASVSQEISLNWDNRDDLASSLTFFNTDFKDKISEVRRCTDGDGSKATGKCMRGGKAFKFISHRINVDKANMRGVEATLTWQLHPQVRLASNYTFTRSEQKSGQFKGQPLNKMPRHMFNATLDYAAGEDLDLWARWNFRGKTSEYLSRTSMAKGTPSFAFVDLGARYQLSRNVSLGLAVYNVFDKQVTNETGFGAVYDGRRYWANASVTF